MPRFLTFLREFWPMPLPLMIHPTLALFAQRTRIPTSARSIGFCVIWVCISSSSSSPPPYAKEPPLYAKEPPLFGNSLEFPRKGRFRSGNSNGNSSGSRPREFLLWEFQVTTAKYYATTLLLVASGY